GTSWRRPSGRPSGSPTRPHRGPARPRRRAARAALARRRAPARRCRRGPLGLHRLPEGALAADLVEPPAGAPEPGAPPAHGRGRDLSEPRRRRAARRGGARRAARRVGRRPALSDHRRLAQGCADVAAGARSITRAEEEARRVGDQNSEGAARRPYTTCADVALQSKRQAFRCREEFGNGSIPGAGQVHGGPLFPGGKAGIWAEGFEPPRAVKLRGFSYRLRLSPPWRTALGIRDARFAVWPIPSP